MTSAFGKQFPVARLAVVLLTCLRFGCATPEHSARSCHAPTLEPPAGWSISESAAIQSARRYLVAGGYTETPASMELIKEELARIPDIDVELNAEIEVAVRRNSILPVPLGTARTAAGGSEWWVIGFPATEEWIRRYPESTGRARTVDVEARTGRLYVSEFDVDPSKLERLCPQ